MADVRMGGKVFGSGTGTPVLLLHGFPLDGRMWARQVGALGIGRRVLVPDLLGFGSTPFPKGPCSLERQADGLAAFVTAQGTDRVVVCGLSMGGYIALAFAERFPERLAGLILADTRAGADSEPARQARAFNAQRVLRDGVGFIAEDMLPKLFHPRTQEDRRAVVDEVRSIMVGQSPEGVSAALRAMGDRPSRETVLINLECPVLILVGEGDKVTPPQEAEAMAALNPRSRLLVIPDAGHLSNMEAPGAFNEGVASFLASLGTPTARLAGRSAES